ncbi:MAG TPA: tetratricopeptide repeat protein [Thermoanaerobaculia bacterium]|jgi:DNA-binding winged helix-turn-helix (wHTH) protein/tetratricopeptide (TPR) repeat protein|nr:tetratricopeptide repeat protein [Thermoanaerobaculia bacterium]
MASRSDEKYLFEFDGFRVDPVRRLLSRQGEPVAITPKAFSILLVLLERAGEVVEKKELLDKVWPGVFVTEANLTQNVFSLRKCLGERANDNRYVVTVPGQGYSFAGEVRRIERFSTGELVLPVLEPPPQPQQPAAAVAQAALPADTTEVPAAPVIPVIPAIPAIPADTGELPAVAAAPPVPVPVTPEALPQIPPRSTRRSLVVWGVLSVLVVMGAVLFGFLFPSATKPAGSGGRLGSRGRLAVAVLDFKSLSPDNDTRWLQKAFAEMLTTELAAGGKMRVIRGEAVAEALRSLNLKDPRSLGRAELERLHDMLGADLVVVGSYVPIGDKLRLDLRVLDAPEGNTVLSMAQVGTQAGLFEMVSATGEKLRGSLGIAALSPRQIQETRALRPSSTESSRLYVEGLTRLRAYDPPGALRYLQQAVEADPGSAVIHSALSQAWFDMGYDSQSVEEARKALDLGQSLPREQRLAIEGRLYKAQKNWEKMSQTYRTLATFFPDDVNYGLQLAESLMMGGRGAEAAETLAALRKLPSPSGDDARIDIMEARNANRLGDYGTLKRASEIAAAKGRRSGQPLVVSQAVVYQGTALLKMGHPQEAIRLFREGVALADQAGYQWGRGMAMANLAAGLQLVGDLEGSQKANEQALVIAERVGSAVGITSQLFALGRLHQDRGRLKEALSLLEQARNWCVKMGDRYMETQVLDAIGEVLLAQGDLAGARQRFAQALELSQAVGNRAKEGLSQVHLATILAYQGELEEARRRHAEAFALLSRVGDSSTAASALAASADAGARLGDLHAAWQQSAQALEAKRQSGDRLGTGRVLGSRAWLAYELGDLAASRSLAEEQRRIAEETGARSLAAWALQNLGRADFAAGNLAAARAAFEESQQVSSDLGEELRAMEIRLDLARLDLAMDRASEATLLSREAAFWYRARGIPGGEIRAQSLLAEALLRQGLPGEARTAVAEARARLAASQDHELRATAAVSLARFEAAAGNPAEALRLLRQAAADTGRTGFTAASLEVRLALGEIQRNLGDATAFATLAEVRKQAEALGFKRVATIAGLRPLPSISRTPARG